ncbi:MAG TPA: hypothetical protein VN628_10805 [Vicinamibacterales bacterium]|nr:hypothetical protein [Vicinamibacterales bacterium]
MRRLALVVAASVALAVSVLADTLPDRVSDDDFWQMAAGFSERPGNFSSDNLLSNERWFQHVVPPLVQKARQNRVYVGVGPEQNFTYIVALKPKMAFIVDVRRGNFDFHLIYKALFEMSADRAEFVSRLFSRPRPDSLSAKSTAEEIFDAMSRVEASDALYSRNMRAIVNQLTKVHAFQLSSADILRMQHIYNAVFVYGPGIQYSTTTNAGRRITREPTYADLMKAADQGGFEHSFLSSEENFQWLKKFETENRLVPLMGDFAGPKALRAVGQYLSDRHAVVSAFYLSNVEEYLKQEGKQKTFCENASTLPIDDTSTFIRSSRSGTPDFGFELVSELGSMTADLAACNGGIDR